MTTVAAIERYLNSLAINYKVVDDDEIIQITLLDYKQSIGVKKTNDFEYSKETIDSIFNDADLDVNQICGDCGNESNIWQLCHTCNEEVCIDCFIKQRVANRGANICSLCHAVNDPNIMTGEELVDWIKFTYEETNKLLAFHNANE